MSGVHQELEYRTIREISARGYSVKEICEILGVSRSGYYKWTNRKRSDRECENEQLLRKLMDIYHAHNGTYGYRRLTDEFNCSHGTNYNVKPACQRSLAIVQAFWYNGEKEDRREEEWNSGNRITGETW